ncbi:hypothetical protein, partial [Sphingomonas sp. Ag1]|uniref:hypothetical protein n=1 Tax=Sphingomonas sp. Ag1 TaxID=1642949 RepID=UPI000A9BD4E4
QTRGGSDHFPDATEEEHTEAIDQINSNGPEFAPAGHRILPPDDYDDLYPPPPLNVRLDALSGQLQEIKAHVEQMLVLQRREREEHQGPPPAGHNNPPPDDEPDLYDVLDSVREVEGELAKEDRENTADVAVLERAESRFARLKKWLREIAKDAPTKLALGALTGVGSAIGVLATNYAKQQFVEIMPALDAALSTVSTWAFLVGGV